MGDWYDDKEKQKEDIAGAILWFAIGVIAGIVIGVLGGF